MESEILFNLQKEIVENKLHVNEQNDEINDLTKTVKQLQLEIDELNDKYDWIKYELKELTEHKNECISNREYDVTDMIE